MNPRPALAAVLLALCAPLFAQEAPAFRDLFSDTWAATDALGRTMPDHAQVGPVKTDQRRVVGIYRPENAGGSA